MFVEELENYDSKVKKIYRDKLNQIWECVKQDNYIQFKYLVSAFLLDSNWDSTIRMEAADICEEAYKENPEKYR